MNIIELHDCNIQLKQIYEALEAIRSVVLTIEEHREYANAYEALLIIHWVLEPIIEGLEEVIKSLRTELE